MNCITKFFVGRLIVLLVVGAISTMFWMGQVRAQEKQDNREVCSVFGVALANAEAIESGDVLCFDREFYDGVRKGEHGLEGETLEKITLWRFVFDANSGRFLVINRVVSEWLELKKITEVSDGRTVVVKDYCGLIDFTKQTWFVKSGKSFYEPGWPTLGKEIEHLGLGIFDPRGTGMASSSIASLMAVKPNQNVIMTGDMLDSYSREEKGIEIRISGPIDDQQVQPMGSYLFDSRTNLPVEYCFYCVFPGGGTTKKNKVFFSWKENSGLFLPIGVRTKSFAPFLGRDSNEINGDLSHEMTLHWFSINERIPEELFERDILKNSKRLQEMVDPVASKATSIIEVLEKFNSKISQPSANEKSPDK